MSVNTLPVVFAGLVVLGGITTTVDHFEHHPPEPPSSASGSPQAAVVSSPPCRSGAATVCVPATMHNGTKVHIHLRSPIGHVPGLRPYGVLHPIRALNPFRGWGFGGW